MKSRILKDYINFNYPVITAQGTALSPLVFDDLDVIDNKVYNANDLSSHTGRVYFKKPLDYGERFYIEIRLDIDQPTNIDFVMVEGLYTQSLQYLENHPSVINFHPLQVKLHGGNRDADNNYTPVFGELPLRYSQGKWITYASQLLNEDNFAPCNTFRISIESYFNVTIPANTLRVEKVFLGKSVEIPLEIVEGAENSNENFQKREFVNGQLTPGNSNSSVKEYTITFRPVMGSKVASEKILFDKMLEIIEDLKSSRDFVFIYQPQAPWILCDRVHISNDSVEIEYTEADQNNISLTLKEIK